MAHSEPMLAEDATGIVGAWPRPAVGNDLTIPRQFAEARPQLWQRDMHRTGDILLLALGVVPHVENDALVRGQIDDFMSLHDVDIARENILGDHRFHVERSTYREMPRMCDARNRGLE